MTDPLLDKLNDLADLTAPMHGVGEMELYEVFSRSATNWEQFGKTRGRVVRRNVTIEQAKRICDDFNDNRTTRQKRRGTMYEFRRQ